MQSEAWRSTDKIIELWIQEDKDDCIKKVFCKHAGVESGEKAVKEFLSFTSRESMEKFLQVPVESAISHQYCMKAVRLV